MAREGVALLVGAGCSCPLGLPTMAGFNARLIEEMAHEQRAGSMPHLVLLERVIETYGGDAPDLEEVMDVVHRLVQLSEPHVLKLFPRMDTSQFTSAIVAQAKQAESFLATLVHKFYGASVNLQSAAQLFQPVFDSLRVMTIRGVFTTNYDMVLDDLFFKARILPVWNGFGANGTGTWKGFAGEAISPPYCKLHGSLNWVRDMSSGQISAIPIPARPSSDRSDEVILYPFRKSFISFQPFFALFDMFWRVLQNVRILVVIGYKLADSLVAEPVQLQCSNAADPLGLVIADPGAEKLATLFPERSNIKTVTGLIEEPSFGEKLREAVEAIQQQPGGGVESRRDSERSPELRLKERKWVDLLASEMPVRERFKVGNKTVVVRLRPYEAGSQDQLTEPVSDFITRLTRVLAQLEGLSPSNPIPVEPDPNRRPIRFYGGALICADGVPLPPDDDSWIFGPDKQH